MRLLLYKLKAINSIFKFILNIESLTNQLIALTIKEVINIRYEKLFIDLSCNENIKQAFNYILCKLTLVYIYIYSSKHNCNG